MKFYLLDAQEEHIDAVVIALPSSERHADLDATPDNIPYCGEDEPIGELGFANLTRALSVYAWRVFRRIDSDRPDREEQKRCRDSETRSSVQWPAFGRMA